MIHEPLQADSTVFVIDDDPGFRASLCMMLEAAGLQTSAFDSAEAFLAACEGSRQGCIILDLRMGGLSGLALLERLQSTRSPMPVIMVTGHGDIAAAVQSMKLGAADFLEKPVDPRLLVERIRIALEQERARRRDESHIESARTRLAELTPREREVLSLLAMGKSSKQVAWELQLSQKTVENHRSHLLVKTGAENSVDLIRLAIKAGIV